MQTLLDIGNYRKAENEERALLWEIGSNYSLLSLCSDDLKICYHVRADMFDELKLEESITELIVPFKEAGLKKVVVCSGFQEALLMPRKYFSPDSDLLNYIYDNPNKKQFYDFVSQWQLVNLYALPTPVLEVVSNSFPLASFRHAYTPLLKMSTGDDITDQIYLHILNKQFRVLVKKENTLQLLQTYAFNTPMDVVYYLIKICKEFGLSPEKSSITISGFIENNSALYEEIGQYFLNISFAKDSGVDMPGHQYPQHFFTSLYNLAVCVS